MMVQAQEEMGEEPIADEAANEEYVPTHSNDPLISGEDSLKLNDLIEICTKLQQRVIDLENTKISQAQEISSLKLRVKRLEKKGGSRTHKLKRLFKVGRSAQVVSSKDKGLGDQEDASKQGRKIDDIDKDAKVTLVDETQGRYGDDLVFDTGILDGEEVFAGQDVAEKEVSTADPVTTAGEVVTTASVEVSATTTTTTTAIIESTTTTTPSTIPKAKSITFRDPGESTTRTTLTPIPSNIKDKGKGKMIESEKPLKKKQQIRLDEELALKLQAEEDEQARLAREKAGKVEEANISWDNVQAMIEADRLLAERLQAREKEELTDEEKARLFVELLEKRKKHFAALRAQEKRNKTPTKAQKKSIMSTYLKHMAGYKQKSSKKAKAEMAQESSLKRAGDELEQEKEKKQKIDDDQEEAEMKKCFEIVQDDEVEINAIPLATKPAPICQDITLLYRSKLSLKEFDREDLENLWKLVKAKHGNTRPEEGYERVLCGDLKTMFEHHVEDLIWRNLQGKKVLLWRLYDSCGIHFVRFKDMHVYMLVEKRYPLTPTIITDILNKKLKS
ncbi:hypothetical protein Tco_1095435 [Tanacetum coccineum]